MENNENNTLSHHGILGQKWGVRRFQNKDGSLTPKGKKRYDKEMDKLKKEESVLKNKERTKKMLDKLDAKKASIEGRKRALNPEVDPEIYKGQNYIGKKNVKTMTDEELKRGVERGRLESEYLKYYPEKVSTGKKFMANVKDGAIAGIKAGTIDAMKSIANKAIQKIFGIDGAAAAAVANKTSEAVSKPVNKVKATVEKAVEKEAAKNADTGRKWTNEVIIDTTSREVTPNPQIGRSYVAGLLPAPRDND